MATTIDQALKNIAALSDASADKVDRLSRSINNLNSLTKNSKTAEEVLTLKKLTQGLQNLLTVEKEYIEINKKIKKAKENNQEINAKDLKQAKNITKQRQHDVIVVKHWGREVAKVYKNAGEYTDKYEADALKNFKTNTLLGKTFNLLGNEVTSFGGKLGLVALGLKAWNRHVQAADIQQNIMIQTFKGLEQRTVSSEKSFSRLRNAVDFSVKITAMSDALAESKAVAKAMGVDVEVVGDSFLKFSRIVGTDNPKALQTLTSSAVAVSRSLGISVPEAVDFVSLRMDKFGGSAASAIASLNNMREEAERINKSFGRTVIRGDDVARTLLDISKQTTMYAIDQRFVGGVLRDNIAKLQATGSSYEQAAKKAQAYTEAVTGKAPEWMKVFSAQDIYSQIADISPEKFVSQFGAELEAAKPGLTNEVQSILNDKSMAKYSKMMLLQEMLSGTSVGIDSMNKQILKLANHPQGVVLIAKQFGVSLSEAQGMVDQAKTMEERTKIINSLMNEGLNTTGKKLTLNKKDFQLTLDQQKEIKDAGEAAINAAKLEAQQRGKVASDLDIILAKKSAEKAAINSIIDAKNEEASVDADLQRLANEEMLNKKAMMKVEGQLVILQKKKADIAQKLAAATDDKTRKELESEMKRIDKRISETELEKTRYEGKEAERKGLSAGLKTNEEITAKLLDEFGVYSDATGKSFTAMIEKYSTTSTFLIAAITSGLATLVLKYTSVGTKLTQWLANQYAKGLSPVTSILDKIYGVLNKGGPGGGGGGGDGPEPKVENTKLEGDRRTRHLETAKPKGRIGRMREKGLEKFGTFKNPKVDFAMVAGVSLAAQGLKSASTQMAESLGMAIKPVQAFGVSLSGVGAKMSGVGSAMAMMPGKLGKLGGSLGMLGAAFEIGTTIGEGLNAVFDKLGWTGEETTQRLANWWTKDSPEKKAADKAETDLFAKMAKNYKLSAEQVKKYDEEAKKAGKSTREYIENVKGVKRQNAAPAATAAAAATKTTTLSAVGMAPGAAEALKPATSDIATPGGVPVTETATADTGGGGSPSGSFVGGPNADGSITLRVDNFMGAFSKAQTMTKQKSKFS